jgi:hypothetical protein
MGDKNPKKREKKKAEKKITPQVLQTEPVKKAK